MRWSNIPIPESHLVGLGIGAILHLLFKQRIFHLPWTGYAIGLPLFIAGIGICAWSVIEAKEMNVTSPNRLLKSGPYARSRNPMYVGWMFICISITFVINSVWIIALLPMVIIYIHFLEIRNEERILEEQFGDEYHQYRRHVRRYF